MRNIYEIKASLSLLSMSVEVCMRGRGGEGGRGRVEKGKGGEWVINTNMNTG